MTRQAIDTPDPSNPVADTASAFCVISLLRPNPEPSAEDHSGATASCSADRGSLRGMVARDWAGIHRVPRSHRHRDGMAASASEPDSGHETAPVVFA